jgi:hypothetical protein
MLRPVVCCHVQRNSNGQENAYVFETQTASSEIAFVKLSVTEFTLTATRAPSHRGSYTRYCKCTTTVYQIYLGKVML